MLAPEVTATTLLDRLGLTSPGARWHLQPVPGAFSNSVWRASAEGAPDCIVKRGSGEAGNPLFANDWHQEARANRQLPGSLVPTRLLHEGAWQIWRYEAGGSLHEPERAAEQLNRLHSATPWDGLSSVCGTPHAWVQQGQAILERLPISQSVYALSVRVPDVRSAPHAVCVVHRDPHLGNWVGGSRALLADWQSVALGNPQEDFACYLSRGMRLAYGFDEATLADASRFLHAAGIALDASWLDVQAAYDFRFACYCAWRVAMRSPHGRYREALEDYVSCAVPVSKPSSETALRSRQ